MIKFNKKTQIFLTSIGLALMLIGFYFSLNWIFGAFMGIWVINDIIREETYLIGRVSKYEFPIMYWVVLAAWIMFAVAYFIF